MTKSEATRLGVTTLSILLCALAFLGGWMLFDHFLLNSKPVWITERSYITSVLPDCTELRTVAAFVWVRGSDGDDFIQKIFQRNGLYPDEVDTAKRDVKREAYDEMERLEAIITQCKKEGKL